MERKTPHAVGVYLAFVQFFFTITWTVYVIFLPTLAAQAGIPKQYVPWILLADQVIFAVMDFTMGAAADRVSRVMGRVGQMILVVTLISTLAFLLLPHVAPSGMPWLLLLFTAIWTITSSALRAPPLMLLGKYAARPSIPWLSSLALFGIGVAGAIAPYLTVTLRDVDPTLPFALSSVALAVATLGIIWAERALAREAPSAKERVPLVQSMTPLTVTFFFAVLLAAIGFQIHSALNSGALYLKFAKAADLQFLAPIFWIGFNVLMVPASQAVKRFGGLTIAGAGAALAGVGALLAQYATSLPQLIFYQLIAGGGWGCVLMSAVAAALAMGHTGREGQLTGGVFALLAIATVSRMAVVITELNKDQQLATFFTWLPAAAWVLAGVILLMLALRVGKVLPAVDPTQDAPIGAQKIRPRKLMDVVKSRELDC